MSVQQFVHHAISFLPSGLQCRLQDASTLWIVSKRHHSATTPMQLQAGATHSSLRYNYRTTAEHTQQLSYAHGASRVQLLGYTINEALDRAVEKHPSREAFVFPKANVRFTFGQFAQQVGILLNMVFRRFRMRCNELVLKLAGIFETIGCAVY